MNEVNYALSVGLQIFRKIEAPLQDLYKYILSTEITVTNVWGYSANKVTHSDFTKKVEYALEKCKVHPHMDKSKLYGYTRDAKNLLYNMKRNTNDPNAFGGAEYQRHRTAMEPKIDKCIVTLDVYNQYCSEIETATANKFHCYFSLYLTTQGFEEEKAMKICGNLGIVLKEHLVYVSIPNDIWNNKILDNNERIKLQQITQQYMSDMDKKARDQATKMAQTVTLKSLFET